MRWNELSIKTNEQGVDIVCALLYDFSAGGVEILGEKLPEQGEWDYIDEALIESYDDMDDMVVKAYFADDDQFINIFNQIKKALLKLKAEKKYGALEIISENRDDSEWNENWKQYFKPFKAGEKIVICPEWEEYTPKEDELVLTIDPGAAFGSGLHETTKMCIGALEKVVDENTFLYDVGCGSGILAIAALKLGAKSVLAVDRDSVCVKVAKENASINGVDANIIVQKADLLNGIKPKKSDVVVANIIADVIIRLNENVKDYLKQDGVYIMSGIIADRLQDVLDSLKSHDFEVIHIEKMEEWRAVTAKIKG